MIPADFDFRATVPEGRLGRFVGRIWYGRGQSPHRRERILPSPSAVLLVILGPPLMMTEPADDATPAERRGAWLSGPHERPIINEPVDETWVIGCTFRPGGISAFLDGSAAEIANRIVDVDAVPFAIPGATMLDELRGRSDPEAGMRALGSLLEKHASAPHAQRRWEAAIDALAHGAPIGVVQGDLGVSRRHFAAEVRRRAGLLPKALQRIARLRGLLDELDARRPIHWSMEAVGAGYFDQPHAIRDFRAFTGMTPTEYVARRREAWGHDIEPGEAANFVPELIR